jgi:hypothetical protein
MVVQSPVEGIIAFITSFPTPQQVLDFRPAPEAEARLSELLYEQSARDLTKEEAREMDYFMVVEHIMRMAKLEAMQRLR